MNQLSLNPNNNIFTGNLNLPDKEALVYCLADNWGTFDWMSSALSSRTIRVEGYYGQHQKPVIFDPTVVAQVSTTSLSGSNLIVNFQDPSYDAFRLEDVVYDNTLGSHQGRVISHGPGTITLEPAPTSGGSLITFDTTTMFLGGAYVTAIYRNSGIGDSTASESLFQTPSYINYQPSVHRDNLTISEMDKGKTFVQIEGTDMWYYAYQLQFLKRIKRQKDCKSFFSIYGNQPSSTLPGGMVNYSRGFIDAINDPVAGGVTMNTSSPMTKPNYETFINKMSDRQATDTTYNIPQIMGRGALNSLQQFTAPYIQFAGKNNTFGGMEVKGFDVYSYTIAGIHTDIMISAFLNNPYAFPTISTVNQYRRMQNTILTVDMGLYDTPGASTQLPAIETIYFGDKEEYWYYKPGVTSSSLLGLSNDGFNNSMGYNLAVSDAPSTGIGYYSNSAKAFMPFRMGIYQTS
jgi:hypothetical protein